LSWPRRRKSSRSGGLGPPFEGAGYYVTRVRHTFDHEYGLRTRFEAERATVNEGS